MYDSKELTTPQNTRKAQENKNTSRGIAPSCQATYTLLPIEPTMASMPAKPTMPTATRAST